jgi:hypothetical protein
MVHNLGLKVPIRFSRLYLLSQMAGCQGKMMGRGNGLVTGGEGIALVATTNLVSNSSWVCPPARKSPRREADSIQSPLFRDDWAGN